MNLCNVSAHDLGMLVKWGDPRFSVLAQHELNRRAGAVEAAAAGNLPGDPQPAASRAGGRLEAASVVPAVHNDVHVFPKGRWS